MDKYYFKTQDLVVGYHGKALIKDINIEIEKGEILTLIGPNGSGKSTILKSITKHLSSISGVVFVDKLNINKMNHKELATKVSVVLTERVRPELMTCYDVVSSGRYPYTNSFGMLSQKDDDIVLESLKKVNAVELRDKDFNEISDGQRQRIMLARAICQEPEIIVLDEPTSFLDIKYKIELLDILRDMATNKGITVIMSLHEIDLAPKISDKVVCVKGDKISRFGTTEEIFQEDIINELYNINNGSYNMIFGSVELSKPQGDGNIFIISGNGSGVNLFRKLQKKNIPFKSGILFENDVDYFVASALAQEVHSQKAFTRISEEVLEKAFNCAMECDIIINTVDEFCEFNIENKYLIEKLVKNGRKIYTDFEESQIQ